MIRVLKTKNIAPIKNLDIEFGSRFSVITGDNGLGKSFILDLVWWSLTRTWVHYVNHRLMHGFMARPKKKLKVEISFSITGDKFNVQNTSDSCNTFNLVNIEGKNYFDYESQSWQSQETSPKGRGIVLYAMPDGSFALWDSAHNYIDTKKAETTSRQPAYIFSSEELWNGLETKDGKILCNGIIRDWASRQKENGLAFKKLQTALKHLSAEDEELMIGDLTRIPILPSRFFLSKAFLMKMNIVVKIYG